MRQRISVVGCPFCGAYPRFSLNVECQTDEKFNLKCESVLCLVQPEVSAASVSHLELNWNFRVNPGETMSIDLETNFLVRHIQNR